VGGEFRMPSAEFSQIFKDLNAFGDTGRRLLFGRVGFPVV
jgi:hypothetical protein